ncbi:hypothetical protein FOA43_001680 [Brettanomyces nanus]|uniref:LST4 longin domain-containing protein n=1 Tax=Eeniella nana TaxID=13502 RepID=A0A875S0B8_EENNA|nr:uncharacterized protein FOA43_001680 [Brettanomyces nanus]QPG74353.1 hypothetical protein FOA43_001680 [Brettanomyces nanus]
MYNQRHHYRHPTTYSSDSSIADDSRGPLNTSTSVSLYGTDSKPPSPTFRISDKLQCFRLVVIQDGGLRNKQTLYDSALGLSGASPNCPGSNLYQKLNKSIYHSMNELAAYMFGYYGILMSESHCITKIHYLPTLPWMPSSVLITRLFSLDPTFESIKRSTPSVSTSTNNSKADDWKPSPSVKFPGSPAHENMSTRFSIGIVIPVGSSIVSMEEEVMDNWSEISNQLVSIQQIVTEKLKKASFPQTSRRSMNINAHSVHGSHSFTQIGSITNTLLSRKLNFASYFLQTDQDLSQQFQGLVRSICSLVETPRLFVALKESNQALIDWASAVASWLELKDGRFFTADPTSPSSDKLSSKPSLKFLARLFCIFMGVRRQILENPLNRSRKKAVRVVIVTGNPIVSQKLVFILAGLLGYDKYVVTTNMEVRRGYEDSVTTRSSAKSDVQSTAVNTLNSSDNPMSFTSTQVIPISIKREMSSHISSSDSSISPASPSSKSNVSSTTKGWKVPAKVAPLTSSSPTVQSLSNVKAERISIPQPRRESSYMSLQNLSTSYGGSHPSTLTSSSSWRGALHFGSFLERWKVGTFAPQHSFANSAVDLTPSPPTEYDEYPWNGNASGNSAYQTALQEASSSSPCSGATTPTIAEIKDFGASAIPGNGSTRINSAFNKIYHNYVAKQKFEIERTTTRLLPKDNEESLAISDKLTGIMNCNLSFSYSKHENISVLSVDNVNLGVDTTIIEPPVTNKLPPLVGYTERYVPEFSLMSCTQTSGLETSIFESMADDVCRMGTTSVSDTYVISLRQREVRLIEAKYPVSDHESFSSSPMSTSFQRNMEKSKLTHDLQRSNLRPKVTLLFSPFLQEKFMQDLVEDVDVGEVSSIDKFDATLNEISQLINRFFCSQSKDGSQHDNGTFQNRDSSSSGTFGNSDGARIDGDDLDEQTCCDKLRGLIETLLD